MCGGFPRVLSEPVALLLPHLDHTLLHCITKQKEGDQALQMHIFDMLEKHMHRLRAKLRPFESLY